MATMNVSIPDPMKAWVQAQINGGHYANASDYVRDLIRRDQQNREKFQALQAAITKGLESGVSEKSMAELLGEARASVKGAAAENEI